MIRTIEKTNLTYIDAKRIEDFSEKTLKHYQTAIEKMVSTLGKNVKNPAKDIRGFDVSAWNYYGISKSKKS